MRPKPPMSPKMLDDDDDEDNDDEAYNAEGV